MILRDLVLLCDMMFTSSCLCWVAVSRVLHGRVLRKFILPFACYEVLFVRDDQNKNNETIHDNNNNNNNNNVTASIAWSSVG